MQRKPPQMPRPSAETRRDPSLLRPPDRRELRCALPKSRRARLPRTLRETARARMARNRRHRHPRRARAQFKKHRGRDPARPDGCHHRLSGSGKSTLAFDLLFSEGQRRFLDSMSPYARQFVEQLEKPDVDLVEGLAAQRRDRAARHARRRQINCGDRNGGLSFSPIALRQNRHAVLSGLRSCRSRNRRSPQS